MLRKPILNRIEQLELNAQQKISPILFNLIDLDSQPDTENNKKAFHHYQIVPRVLQGITTFDTSQVLLNNKLNYPIIIGPCAFHKLVTPEGELATAAAADATGTLMTLSTMSSCSIEEVAKASTSPKWFQLYLFKNKEITKTLVERAEKAGYQAIMVTADVPVMGLRLRDMKNQFCLPESVTAINLQEANLSSLSEKTQGSRIKEHTDETFDADYLGKLSIGYIP